ncbi:MAG: hypothetical protein AAF745_09960 [Planctomycetota bacterium]
MKFLCTLLMISLGVALTGCQPQETSAVGLPAGDTTAESDNHEGHDHGEGGAPESLGEAVNEIRAMGAAITSAFARGKPDDAHHELHEIGHLIESLPELAAKSGLPESKQTTVKTVTEALMVAFGKLDGTLHGGDDVNVDEISQTISEQLQKVDFEM